VSDFRSNEMGSEFFGARLNGAEFSIYDSRNIYVTLPNKMNIIVFLLSYFLFHMRIHFFRILKIKSTISAASTVSLFFFFSIKMFNVRNAHDFTHSSEISHLP